jgi:flagellar hook-length control protein FliK
MEDGKLQATFRAENQLTKDMLQMNIAVLKETLYNQGIRVTQLNITTGLEYRQQQQNMAYAFLDQGRQSGSPDHQERRSGGSGGNAQDEGGDVYRNDASRDRRYIAGGLDLFA